MVLTKTNWVLSAIAHCALININAFFEQRVLQKIFAMWPINQTRNVIIDVEVKLLAINEEIYNQRRFPFRNL